MSNLSSQSNSLETEIQFIKGVGPKRAHALESLNIFTIKDLVYYFPRKYLDRTNIKYIREIKIGEEAVIIGKIVSFGMKQARKRRFFQMMIKDSTGYINCVWFNSI